MPLLKRFSLHTAALRSAERYALVAWVEHAGNIDPGLPYFHAGLRRSTAGCDGQEPVRPRSCYCLFLEKH